MPEPGIRLERLCVGATLAVLMWLPLPLGSNVDWATGVLVMLAGGLGTLWAMTWLRSPQAQARQAATLRAGLPLLGLLLAAQLWVAVQWLAGLTVDNGETFRYLMLGLAYSLLFLVVVSLFHTRKRLTLLLAVLVISGTLQAFWGSLMTLSGIEWLLVGPKDSYIGVATGTFVNRNHLAGYLEMTLACGIGLLLALRDGRPFSWVNLLELLLGPKARLRLALVIMVIALVMNFREREAYAAAFAAGIVTDVLRAAPAGTNVAAWLLATFVIAALFARGW